MRCARFSGLLAFLCGLAGALFAAAGARLTTVWRDGSLQAAAITLALAVVALVLGWRLGRRRPSGNTIAALALAAAGLWAWLVPRLMPSVTMLWLRRLDPETVSYAAFLGLQGCSLALVIVPPLCGCGFFLGRLTAVARADRRARGSPARPRSLLLAAAGCAGGLLLAGSRLVPWSSVEEWLLAGAVVAAVAVGVALQLGTANKAREHAWRPVALGLAPLLAVAALALMLPAGEEPLLAQALPGRWLRTGGAAFRLPGKLIFHAESARNAWSVRGMSNGERLLCRDGQAWIALNGDLPSQSLGVHLPLLLHPAPRRIALLGLGGGAGAAAAATHAVESIVCAEPERLLPDAMRVFQPVGRAAVLDDRRLRLLPLSARMLLTGARGDFDAIVAQPGFAWTLGGAADLTLPFFERCRRALTTNGIASVTVEAQALSPPLCRGILADFRAVFPHVQVWSPQVNSYLLLGSAMPLEVRADRLMEALERREVFRDLVRIGIRSAPDLLANYVMDGGGVARCLGGGQASAPRGALGLACATARARLARGHATDVLAGIEAARNRDLRWLTSGSLEAGLHAALVERAGRQRAARAAMAAARVASRSEDPGAALKQAREAAALNPDDAFLERMLQAMEQEAAFRLARGDFTGAARRFGDVLGILPERPTALYGAALADRGLGRAESAFLHLARAVAARPEETTFRLALAENLREQGREEEALGQYRQLLEREPEHAAALLGLAELLSRAQPLLRDMPGAIRAAEQAALLTGYRDRRIAMTLADLYIAEGRVLEGVSLKRHIKIALP